MSDERMQILRMIEEGQISAQEGIKLLEALSAAEENVAEGVIAEGESEISELPAVTGPPIPESEPIEEVAAEQPAPPGFPSFGHLWLIPLAVGAFVGALGMGLILLIQAASPGSFFLICGWVPLFIGLAIVGLAFWSRTARWLHVRIHGEQRISISFPLPLRLTGWILRLVRPFVPQLQETGLDEVILSLDENLGGEDYFYVDVQDDEDGEHVQVYIG